MYHTAAASGRTRETAEGVGCMREGEGGGSNQEVEIIQEDWFFHHDITFDVYCHSN